VKANARVEEKSSPKLAVQDQRDRQHAVFWTDLLPNPETNLYISIDTRMCKRSRQAREVMVDRALANLSLSGRISPIIKTQCRNLSDIVDPFVVSCGCDDTDFVAPVAHEGPETSFSNLVVRAN